MQTRNTVGLNHFAQICMYSAYLVAARDSDFRSAFELLYSLHKLYIEIEQMKAKNQMLRRSPTNSEWENETDNKKLNQLRDLVVAAAKGSPLSNGDDLHSDIEFFDIENDDKPR